MDQVAYTVMHIDDSRLTKRTDIRNKLFFYDEATDIEFVRGADVEQVKRMRAKYPNFSGRAIWTPKVGEVGVWYSQMNCWTWAKENNKHLMVFEDDAMLVPNFEQLWFTLLEELPSDYDFLSIFVPNNQEGDFYSYMVFDNDGVPKVWNYAPEENSTFNFSKNLAKVYQGYSCVATMYSPKGAAKLLDIADDMGMYTPVDCFLFLNAHVGKLDGYAPKPSGIFPRMVNIEWEAPSTIHHTPIIDMNILTGEV